MVLWTPGLLSTYRFQTLLSMLHLVRLREGVGVVSGLSGLALIASDTSFNASLGSTSGGVGGSGLSGLLTLIVSDSSFSVALA